MKFGLFGGASAADQNTVTDSSKNYHHFIDYVCEAERLGFHSVFMVEHHFTGFNQISASLNFLSLAFPQFSRHLIMSKLNWRESHEENEIYV